MLYTYLWNLQFLWPPKLYSGHHASLHAIPNPLQVRDSSPISSLYEMPTIKAAQIVDSFRLQCNAEMHNTDNRWNNLNCIFIINVTRKYIMRVPSYRKQTCLRIPNNSKKNSYVGLEISMYVFKLSVHGITQYKKKKWKNRVCLK